MERVDNLFSNLQKLKTVKQNTKPILKVPKTSPQEPAVLIPKPQCNLLSQNQQPIWPKNQYALLKPEKPVKPYGLKP